MNHAAVRQCVDITAVDGSAAISIMKNLLNNNDCLAFRMSALQQWHGMFNNFWRNSSPQIKVSWSMVQWPARFFLYTFFDCIHGLHFFCGLVCVVFLFSQLHSARCDRIKSKRRREKHLVKSALYCSQCVCVFQTGGGASMKT